MDTVIDVEGVWRQFGMDRLAENLETLFQNESFSLRQLWEKVLQGDIAGILNGLGGMFFGGAASQAAGLSSLLAWILALGVLSALVTHFAEIFDRHQIADLSFYFMYLLLTAVLLKCFLQAADTAKATLGDIVTFIRILVPTYLMCVGMATGSVTVGAYYQILLLVIYGVEKVLLAGTVPFIYSYCLLAVINGVWSEEKLALLMDLVGRGIRGALKACVGIVTGLNLFQSVLAPAVDSVKAAVLQKALSAIPGVGGAADGVVELMVGSAVIIKNSIGMVFLILLLVLCAVPLLRILLAGCLLKAAAALMGIVSDHRITSVTDRVGEGGMLLFHTVGTALLLFLITISMMAAATNRGM